MNARATALSVILAAQGAQAQQSSIQPEKAQGPAIVRPYLPVEVPPVRLSNSGRLRSLIRAGTLYLSRQDAIALALENNIDLEIARYNPIIAKWRVTRAQAGGLLPGVPSAASQAGSVAVGQGVAGSQAAAGVRIPGTGGAAAQTTNVTISQIGPVTQTLDPAFQEASTFSHTSRPQPNIVQSITPVLVSETRAHSANFQQGFITGGSVTVRFSNNYLKENSPTDVLNPSSAPVAAISAQHNLLRGFGIAVNARNITVAKMNTNISDLTFRNQVITIVTRVLNAYDGLSASYADIKAKQNALDAARAFSANLKEALRIGTVAPLEVTRAETQVVTSQQALTDSQTTLEQQQVQLKNLLSRTGTADPLFGPARIQPVDTIMIPPKDDLPPVDELVNQAIANRPDIQADRANSAASEVLALGTRNGLRPNLQVFAAESHAGLAGEPRIVASGGDNETADRYFVGGIGTALGQIFRRNFPTDRVGAFFQTPIRNWQAQADHAIDQLQLRQSDLTNQKDLNQVQVDVLNNAIALQQARARYDAAVGNRVLQEQLLAGEQQKYRLGASTPYDVIQMQRDLTAAQSAEIAALVAYSNARIALDQTTGATLEVNHISIVEAQGGRVGGQ